MTSVVTQDVSACGDQCRRTLLGSVTAEENPRTWNRDKGRQVLPQQPVERKEMFYFVFFLSLRAKQCVRLGSGQTGAVGGGGCQLGATALLFFSPFALQTCVSGCQAKGRGLAL